MLSQLTEHVVSKQCIIFFFYLGIIRTKTEQVRFQTEVNEFLGCRSKPTHLWSINLRQRRQEHKMGKRVSSASRAGKVGELHVNQ